MYLLTTFDGLKYTEDNKEGLCQFFFTYPSKTANAQREELRFKLKTEDILPYNFA